MIKKALYLSITILILVPVGIYVWDVMQDRSKSITIRSRMAIYRDWDRLKDQDPNEIVDTVEPGEKLKVLRIRYGKDYRAVKVEKGNGSVGWMMTQGNAVELL